MRNYLLLIIVALGLNTISAQNYILDLTSADNNDYVEIPALNISAGDFTIEAFIKPIGDQIDWSGIVFTRASGGGCGINIIGQEYSGVSNQLGYHWGGGNYNWDSDLVLTPNQWSHIALVINIDEGDQMGKATMYLNGVPADNPWYHSAVTFDQAIFIGADPNNASRNFKGFVDEVRIWNSARTTQEIQDNMSKELAHPELETNLVCYYNFNQSSGTSVADVKGNYNGTLVNLGDGTGKWMVSDYVATSTNDRLIKDENQIIISANNSVIIHSEYSDENFQLYDMTGKCVYSCEVQKGESIYPMEQLSGIYIGKLTQNGKVYSKKIFIKN